MPPSAEIVSPVTKRAASDARNTTTWRDVVRGRPAPERRLRLDLLDHSRDRLVAGPERGVDDTGRHRVHPDPGRAELHRERARERRRPRPSTPRRPHAAACRRSPTPTRGSRSNRDPPRSSTGAAPRSGAGGRGRSPRAACRSSRRRGRRSTSAPRRPRCSRGCRRVRARRRAASREAAGRLDVAELGGEHDRGVARDRRQPCRAVRGRVRRARRVRRHRRAPPRSPHRCRVTRR